MAKSSGNMKTYWSLNVVITLLSFVLVVKSVNVGLNFYEDTTISSGSTGTVGRLVKKDERVPVVATEFGEVSSIDIDDGVGKGGHKYDIQFITLEPNSVFLPVLLHADMVFYVQTGSGKISWTDGDEPNDVNLQRGDVYRLKSGTLFYLHSSLEAERPRLRIIAIFTNPEEELQGRLIGPYSSINDLVRGFDKRILQAAFQVSEEVIEEITSATDTPAIVHAETKKKNFWQHELMLIKAFLGIQRLGEKIAENKKKHTMTFNFFKEDPDFKNCNGWSTSVTKKNLHALKGSNIGVFMVNLTKGSMMGPHWNPMAAEVSIVLEGEGMVRVVCPSALTNKECKNSRFKIEEGDVFTVPRFHPMAQTSFNNGSLVFMGFSTTTKKNYPQFLAGKASVLQTLSRPILGASFNVSNTTIDQLLAAQEEAIILDCTSCAEEQEMLLEDQIEKERQQEEEKRKEEEEEKRKKEEEEQRKREEEREREERRKREEEEEEEQRRREEEERKREEEEEEQRRKEEEQEEEQRRKRKEEARKREEEEEEEQRRKEEEQKRQEEDRKREEEARKREEEKEEEEREREEEEEEEQREREEEEEQKRQEEEQRRREEEVRRKEEEEEQRRQEKKEEEEREREKEIEQAEEREREKEIEQKERKKEEEEQRRQEEDEKKRRREEEERQRKEEEEGEQKRQEEKERQREQEEERQRAEEKEQRKREEERRRQEKEKRRHEERGRGEEEETEQEIAKREEEERREWEKQAEEAARKRKGKEESGDEKREERRFLQRRMKVTDAHW